MSTSSQEKDQSSIEAARIARKGNPPLDVRKWLQSCTHATFGTISIKKSIRGFPLGSIVPFCVDHLGRPVILIAGIAAHTRNLKADNRGTLFVHDPQFAGDPQSSWRASLIGRFSQLVTADSDDLPSYCEVITKEEEDHLMARYVERVPNAKGYLKTHDFSFWRLSHLETIRYIAGFGRICWVDSEKYQTTASGEAFAAMISGAMQHMNDDHQENMKEICRAFYKIDPNHVEMVAMDIGGMTLQTQEPEALLYTSFDSIVENVGGFKAQIIASLKKARTVNVKTEANDS